MSNQDEQDDESFAEARLVEAIENQLAAVSRRRPRRR